MARIILIPILCLLVAGCSRTDMTAGALLEQADALEQSTSPLSLPRRICLYEEALAANPPPAADVRQAVVMKLEACRRNYFQRHLQDGDDELTAQRQDLEVQAQSLKGRNEQLQRLVNSLKAENAMLRENQAALEATVRKLQREPNGK